MPNRTVLAALGLVALMLSGTTVVVSLASPQMAGHNSITARVVSTSSDAECDADTGMVHLSGKVMPILGGAVPPLGLAVRGDSTESQVISILASIETQLGAVNLRMADVSKMQVLLAKDHSADGVIDHDRFIRGYARFFGVAERRGFPGHLELTVGGQDIPAYLAEIEVIASRGMIEDYLMARSRMTRPRSAVASALPLPFQE